MSSFRVNPTAVTEFAAQLQEARRDVERAQLYARRHGSFTFHEAGAIGALFGRHSSLIAQLDKLLVHLADITDESDAALSRIAAGYDHTDERTAARIDATYVETSRPPLSRD